MSESDVGIVDYDAYVPRYRISADAYADAWGRCAARIDEKRVSAFDEDVVTMGLEAIRGVDTDDAKTLTLASTSWPQPGTTASGPFVTATDLPTTSRAFEFGTSWRAGLEALEVALEYSPGVAVVADAPRADPSEDADHLLGDGAAAFRTGTGERCAVELLASSHVTGAQLPGTFESDDGVTDLSIGQYDADAYADAVGGAIRGVLEAHDLDVSDVTHAVLPQDDVKTAWRTGKGLGFSTDQLAAGFLVKRLGFAGAAATPLGLAAALDESEPGDRLVVASYGAGHGAIALLFEAGEGVDASHAGVQSQLENGEQLTYVEYLKHTEGI
jgi:3-hydroxy-3-methylglutaryl CoA synthase